MLTERPTLTQFLLEQRRDRADSCGELDSLVLQVALGCKAISKRLAWGRLAELIGEAGAVTVQGAPGKPEPTATELSVRLSTWGCQLTGTVPEAVYEPYLIRAESPRGDCLLIFDPLDGSANIDVNVSLGSIFSILRAPIAGEAAEPSDFMQSGTKQLAAGYAIYGPATVLVLTVGAGVNAFTLDPHLGEFFLTGQNIQVPEVTAEYAGSTSEMCLVASLVAEAHRVLTRGGVSIHPRGPNNPTGEGRLRLVHEANPIAFLIEQAGGLATTGRERILEVTPDDMHQRIGCIFGSRGEVERLNRYHWEAAGEFPEVSLQWNPLYGQRGLFNVV